MGDFKFENISKTESAVLDNITAGTASPSKAVVLDSNGEIDKLIIENMQLKNGTPVNAEVATGTLTISGVVIDGETVTIGSDVYEMAADVAQTVEDGNIAVDLTGSMDASQGTLTVDTQPTAGDTMTIGGKEYTFVPDGTANADGEVSIGLDVLEAQANIVAAINGTDGINTAHTLVTIADFVANAAVITALVAGTAGDTIATTSSFTAGTNQFDAVTLGTTQAGSDCVAADAVTAIIAAITASGTEDVSAEDGVGDTVVLTANTAGVAANSITTTEEMANGEFGAENLEGGVDGTVASAKGFWYADNSYLYYAIAANTVADSNWRRVSLGNTY